MRRFLTFPAHRVLLAAVAAAVGLFVPSRGAPAQGLEYVKAHYTKYEYKIPMRDGVRLFTAVYVPKDTAERYPILMTRTPYGVQPYGVARAKADLGPSPAFGKEGYIFAYQDVRGRWMSEGEFVDMRPHNPEKRGPGDVDESSDTFDTIDWLLKYVPNHNGRVEQWGISYPGFYHASCGMIDAHPALLASSPQAPDLRLVRRRRLAPQRRSAPIARLQFSGQSGAAPARADQDVQGKVRPRHARRIQVLPSSLGPPSAKPTRFISRERWRSGTS